MDDKLIFFVDDEQMFLNLLEYTFKCKNGYNTKSFSSGEDCIANLYLNPDLVVIDFFLSTSDAMMTGMDVVRKIKETHPNTLMVFLSGNDDENVINESKREGVKRFIIKNNYFIDNLVECISELFSSSDG